VNPSDILEQARQRLRDEAEASSLRLLARRIGVNHNTLAQFLDGSVQRPRAEARQRILDYVQNRPTTGSADGGRAADVALEPTVEQRRDVNFWEEQQRSALQMMRFAADLHRQAAEMQAEAIRSQQQIVAHTRPMPAEAQPIAKPVPADGYGHSAPPTVAEQQDKQKRPARRKRGGNHGN